MGCLVWVVVSCSSVDTHDDVSEKPDISSDMSDEEVIELVEELGFDLAEESEISPPPEQTDRSTAALVDGELAGAAGFLPDTLSSLGAEVTSEDGYFKLTVDIEKSPDFLVSLFDIDSKERLLEYMTQGTFGYDDYYITEERDDTVSFYFRFPEQGPYRVWILGPEESGVYSPVFEYRVDVDKGLGKNDFYHKVIDDLLEEGNAELLDSFRSRRGAPFVVPGAGPFYIK